MKTHPGPQRKIGRVNGLSVTLYVLLGCFILITVYSFFKANINLLPEHLKDYFSVIILDLDESITILVVIIGAIVARSNLSYNMRPYLVYEVDGAEDSESKIVVRLKNIGAGIGYIQRVDYRYITDDKTALKDIDDLQYSRAFEPMKIDMVQRQIAYGTDFLIHEITNGYAIGPSTGETILFTLSKSVVNRVIAFDIRIEITGGIGDTYSKEIFCVPRKIHWSIEDEIPPAKPSKTGNKK